MSKTSNLSRRHFLKATSIIAGMATLGGVVAPIAKAALPTNTDDKAEHNNTETKITVFRGRMFITNDELFSTLSEASERIFPKDENGPGAKELFVPYFIDNQLAGAWGYNAREYIMGPHSLGAKTQGYQTPLLRNELFTQGLIALNSQSQKIFKKKFLQIEENEKDTILEMCDEGKIPTQGFSSSYFFSLLKTAVLAGVYADPIYGGNSNMEGWKMKEYPGAQMSYLDIINSNKFEKIDPVSLASMQ